MNYLIFFSVCMYATNPVLCFSKKQTSWDQTTCICYTWDDIAWEKVLSLPVPISEKWQVYLSCKSVCMHVHAQPMCCYPKQMFLTREHSHVVTFNKKRIWWLLKGNGSKPQSASMLCNTDSQLVHMVDVCICVYHVLSTTGRQSVPEWRKRVHKCVQAMCELLLCR